MRTTARRPGAISWRGAIVGLVVVLLVAILGIVGHFQYQRIRSERAMEQAVAELDRDDPGWRLEEIEAARETVPETENASPVIKEAVAKLRTPWNTARLDEELADRAANERLPEAVGQMLAAELISQEPAVIEARRLVKFERGRHPIHYHRIPYATSMPHVEHSRMVANLLRLDALDLTERDDLSGALRSCVAIVNAGRSIGDEPLLISMLVRIAIVAIARTEVQRVLGQGVAADADLASLQRVFEREAAWRGLPQAMRGERAVVHGTLEAIERGEVSLDELAGSRGRKSGTWSATSERDRVRLQHPRALQLMTREIEVARLPLPERGLAQQEFTREVKSATAGDDVIRLLLPSLNKVEEAERRHHGRVRTAVAMVAAERYRLKHNRWPANIEELVGMANAEVLTDPCDGRALRLRREQDGLVIWSVGIDGIDNGGVYDPTVVIGKDEVVRLWDGAHRRRPPTTRPMPEKSVRPHGR